MRVILVGGNKTVYFLARQFGQRGYHVTIINREPQRCKQLAHQTTATVVLGEGSDPSRLEEAGARQADVLMALTTHDADNLIACQIAQKRYGVPRTLALVNDPENEVIFRELGITVAFSATRIIASLIEQQTNFEDISAMVPIAEGRINVTEVRLDPHSPVIGKTLQELNLRGGALIGSIIRDGHILVPRGSTELKGNDHLVLISEPKQQEQALRMLCGEDHR